MKNIRQAIVAFGLTAADLGLSGTDAVKAKKGRRGRPANKTLETSVAISKAKRGRKSGKASKTRSRKTGAPDKRSVVAPKYRDAGTGATWTGRGKQPRWLADALKSGKKIENFQI